METVPVKDIRPSALAQQTSGLTALMDHPDHFVHRHIGPNPDAVEEMLSFLGFESLDAMIEATVPQSIRLGRSLKLPPARSEFDTLTRLKAIASENCMFRSFIGMGYYNCITPPVIQRNILENPGWYTQYTPYQAEIAQGRLEGLLNFQTMICDLTGLEIANASLLDEATAAAEAVMMCHRLKTDDNRKRFLVASDCHPQNIDVVKTRAQALGIEVEVSAVASWTFDSTVFGVLLQYPGTDGAVHDYHPLVAKAHAAGVFVVVAADLLSLTLLRPPGEIGADIAVGSAQRFGIPLGYGGPHAGYMATRDVYKRQMPGRLVGMSKDSRGRPALRLALGTREQHIRREKATSNICTAQALLANMAAMYASYHGPEGLKKIAQRILLLTRLLAEGLRKLGCQLGQAPFFDTLCVRPASGSSAEIVQIAELHLINFRVIDSETLGISLDETTRAEDVMVLLQVFNKDAKPPFTLDDLAQSLTGQFGALGFAGASELTHFPDPIARSTTFLSHPVFNRYHSETEMLRYLRKLESRDLSLTTSMIPLGSCTMKLNATSEMMPVSWPEFASIHPFVPQSQTKGYRLLFRDLESWLGEITGFAGVSLQPNAGSQGEYSGLLVIRRYNAHRGQEHRDVCLIPQSAHGTNPASAVMAGFKVVSIACDKNGNIDVNDLRAKAQAHRESLAALMVTYPSTHGVFEESIRDICQIIHECDGQVYMDGANMNAQVGLCRPGDMGADVCHLNLHKTFSIPHGGGGPGMAPIGVAQHLLAFLPGHSVVPPRAGDHSGAVASAPWGSASILPISWVYIAAMGPDGLTQATKIAILNANYIAHKLGPYFPALYKGHSGMVAHECILDLRQFKSVTVEDVAKRLMDFGFHAPTISWPVPGTMMVEPTESEPKEELDRFCDAMIAIHGEITAIESGQMDRQNNPLKNAPHTADMLAVEHWEHPYSREEAAYPVPSLREQKFWPAVGRIDNVFGDRNPVCTCAGMA